MKNINEFGVQEMDIKEMKEENGGTLYDYLVAVINYVVKETTVINKLI
ncbi:hypothetical protein [Seonamhaeicola sp.]